MQNDNELYHYGVLGMKWGVRRYQDRYGVINKAGRAKGKELESEYDRLSTSTTLTKRGKKRVNSISKQYQDITGKDIASRKNSTASPPSRAKRLQDMTNEELQTYNTRKQLETQYLSYQPKPQVSKGKQFAATVITKVVAPVAIKAGQEYLKDLLKDVRSSKDAAKAGNTAKVTNDAVKAGKKAAKEVWSGTVEGTPNYKTNKRYLLPMN